MPKQVSDKSFSQANINTIADVYQKQRHNMTSESRITLANLLAARDGKFGQLCSTMLEIVFIKQLEISSALLFMT